jgi:hypothetical protein
MPLDVWANWIFRVLPLSGAPECLEASRRSLYALAAPVWLALAVLLLGMADPDICDGLPALATRAAWADHDTVTTLDWCVE